MSKIYIGAKFKNSLGYEFIVIEQTNDPKYWVVKFASGYVATAKNSNIPYGKVKDYWAPSVYGKGFLGAMCNIPKRGDSLLRKKYDLWANMIKRTSGKYREAKTYAGVEVAPEWLNFSVFQIEIESVEGYEAWVKDSTLCLDKDLSGQRLYSRATCSFIPLVENTREAANRRWATDSES
jgi:hypothetical protein